MCLDCGHSQDAASPPSGCEDCGATASRMKIVMPNNIIVVDLGERRVEQKVTTKKRRRAKAPKRFIGYSFADGQDRVTLFEFCQGAWSALDRGDAAYEELAQRLKEMLASGKSLKGVKFMPVHGIEPGQFGNKPNASEAFRNNLPSRRSDGKIS